MKNWKNIIHNDLKTLYLSPSCLEIVNTGEKYQGVRNVCFSEILACFAFLKHPFWDSPFCLIPDDFIYMLRLVQLLLPRANTKHVEPSSSSTVIQVLWITICSNLVTNTLE